MTYQPVTPLSGVAGWKFLNRTHEKQSQAFNDSAQIKRDTAYFRDKISSITTAEDLVADRQLLQVALGAFGLDDDLNKRFFVRKVLEEGTSDPRAMANRLVDKRYAQLADAFGFGTAFGPRTDRIGFADEITSAYKTRQFEIAVGNQDQSLRIAMGFQREISTIAATTSGDTGWFSILGSPPNRKVIEGAFNLPQEFASLDIDKQVETLKSKSRTMFGSDSIAVFKNAEVVETTLQRYLVRAGIDSFSAASSGSAALTLLQLGSQPGSGTVEALFGALYQS